MIFVNYLDFTTFKSGATTRLNGFSNSKHFFRRSLNVSIAES